MSMLLNYGHFGSPGVNFYEITALNECRGGKDTKLDSLG